MSRYLDEHLPHLKALHTSLGLPTTALEEDKTKIDAAIKAVVVSIVRERETEVERWREEIELARKDVVCLGKALGDRTIVKVEGDRTAVKLEYGMRDVKMEQGGEALPQQHVRLLKQTKELEQVYRERLAKVDELQEALTALANLLGPPFEPPKPLQPVAGPSNGLNQARLSLPPVAAPTGRKVSGTSFKPETAQERKRSNVGPVIAVDESMREVWMEVSNEVIEALEVDFKKARDERDNRRTQLLSDFVDLHWLHDELALPPLPNGTGSHSFPIELLPDRHNEETPGAYQAYEKTLGHFIANFKEENVEREIVEKEPKINEQGNEEEEEEDEADKGRVLDLKGLEDLQPEVGLINWINELSELWNKLKEAYEVRIQEIFNQIEPHWTRMGVDAHTQELFFEMNRGSGEPTIAAYEAELERVLELRRASLSQYMLAVRSEIEGLWLELMMSDEEKDEFVGFIDDNYTEELLKAHEEYSESLRDELESKATIIPKVREWHTLVEEEEELERLSSDPNRFKMRGGALLREEKLRKRIQVLKPRIEGELLKLLPQWEKTANKPFLIRGERVVDVIQDALEAKEAAKEAKKRARQGLGPTKTVKATPAPSARAPATVTRKRAPEATPLPGGLKRQKPMPASHMKPMTTTTRRLPQSTMSTAGSMYMTNRHHVEIGTPTPVPCNLPRPQNMNGRAVSSSSIYMSKIPPQPQSRIPSAPVGSHAMLGKDATRRPPKRESFKPRSSIIPMMIGTEYEGRPEWDLGEVDEGMEEAGEVF